jgi:hypothetical protein
MRRSSSTLRRSEKPRCALPTPTLMVSPWGNTQA